MRARVREVERPDARHRRKPWRRCRVRILRRLSLALRRRAASDSASDSAGANVLVVSGTVTTALAPYVVALYQRMGPGARVMSFGACAATGGPYWDSYAVVDGVDRLVPVDVYVPGCPPSPEALIDGLRTLLLDVRA